MVGKIYDLNTFAPDERRLFNDLYKYSQTAESWMSLVQPHIFHRDIIDRAQKALGPDWQEWPLYRINLDLMGRIGVRTGEFRQPDLPYPDPIREE